MINLVKIGVALCAAIIITGCTKLNPEAAFLDVAGKVETRIGHTIAWDQATTQDNHARASVQKLLSRPLTPASAIQIALLNNPALQANYADLGIAQAALVQAGLLKNPVFDGAVTWFNDAGGTPNLAFGVAWSFIDLFNRPLRQAVAESRLEETKLEVASRVIGHAAGTHIAFVDDVAARQEKRLFDDIVHAAEASVKAAKALRKAGNITALQVEMQKSLLASTRLEASQAEVNAVAARERLAVLMGVAGTGKSWRAPAKMAQVPAPAMNTGSAETRAVLKSLDIEAARQRLVTLGQRYQLVKRTSLIPDLEAGAEFEREVEVEDGVKNIRRAIGPTFEAEIPIFDHGQAKKAGAYFQIKKAENELRAVTARVRSGARLARSGLQTARAAALHVSREMRQQAKRVLEETQRGYNAMQQSVFQLVSAKRQEILARRQEIQALRAYWRVRIRFQTLMNGKLPDGAGAGTVEIAAASQNTEDQGGH